MARRKQSRLLDAPISNHNLLAALLENREPTPAEIEQHKLSVARQEIIKLDNLLNEFGIERNRFELFVYRDLALALARKYIDGFKNESEIGGKVGRKPSWTPIALAYLLAMFEKLQAETGAQSKELYYRLADEIKAVNPKLKLGAGAMKNRLTEARALRDAGELPDTPHKKWHRNKIGATRLFEKVKKSD
jgi:hypothetical protein